MNQKTWTAVDDYINSMLVPSDSALDTALKTSMDAGLPTINVTPSQGKLLHLLARLVNARNILEIGTLGGYSTIWLARALAPGGRLITLEANPKHVEVAAANVARAGLTDAVELREGKALETLPELAAEGLEPFDFVFIDADKQNNAAYFEWALRLSHKGALIVVDNVIRQGEIANAESTDPNVQGTRRLFELLAKDTRVLSSAAQTVGSKGYDGFVIAFVTEGR